MIGTAWRWSARRRLAVKATETVDHDRDRDIGNVRIVGAVGAVVALTALALSACTTPTHAPQAVRPQWVYAGPAIVLKQHPRHTTDDGNAASTALRRAPVTATATLRYFNAKRAEVGLPPLRDDNAIHIAAVAHARYLLANHTFGHSETAGAPGFTGTDVTARINRLRVVDGASEVVSMQSNGRPESEAIAQLFASPYHRGVILFDWLHAGAAVSGNVADRVDMADSGTGAARSMSTLGSDATAQLAVVDFADFGQAIASNELIAYPFDGQTDAPVAWTDDELPDPMGDDMGYRGRRIGYPITLSGGPNAHIALQRVDLLDQAGHTVRCHIAALTPADRLRNTAVCTPLDPLRAQTAYTVRAVGLLKEGRYIVDVPFDLTWHFRTGNANADDTGAADNATD